MGGYSVVIVVFWWWQVTMSAYVMNEFVFWQLWVVNRFSVFGSCLENAILTTSPPYKMSLPDKTSILTKCPYWQNVHPDKTYIRDKTSSNIQSAQESSVNIRKKFCHPNYSRLRHTNLLVQHNFCIFSEKHWI